MRGAKKDRSVQIYVTQREHDRWVATAEDFDMNLAEFVRNAVDWFINIKTINEGEGKRVSLAGRLSYKSYQQNHY